MIARLIGLIFFLGGIYILLVFFSPQLADTYGNKELNTKIRNLKEYSLTLSGAESPKALIDQLSERVKPMLENTKKTADSIEKTVTTKAKQAEEAGVAVGQAYDAVKSATDKINTVTSFSGGTR